MKTFAVIGLGRFGAAVAIQLFNMGYEVLAVDKSAENVNEVADFVTQAVCADPMESGVMRELGIKNYDTVIVAIGTNMADSILITMALKEAGVKKVVCKASSEDHKKVLQKVGADVVIIPEHEAGIKLAANLVSENVFDVIDISDEYSIADLIIPQGWQGKTLMDLDLRKKYGINVIAIKDRASGKIATISPNPTHSFKVNDIMVVVGKNEMIQAISKLK